MIKGLISLFTSGIIFNPLVLLGVVFGVFCMVTKEAVDISAIFKDYHLYLFILFVSVIYIFSFKKVYKDDGDTLDWGIMVFQSIWGVVKFTLSSLLTMAFVVMLSF